MKMPFLLISPKIVPKIQLIKKGGCFEYHAVIADKIKYRYVHRASICPALGMDRRSFFMPKPMGKYKRLEVFYLSKPVYTADKPSDCHYCYFWTNGRKGCRLGRNNCYYLISLPPKPKSECDGCPYGRADSTKPNMGLTTWKNAPKGRIRKSDVTVAKNYLNETEMRNLNEIVTMYLDYAERQARRGNVMYMADWVKRLDAFLQFNEEDILHDKGKVTAAIAKAFAEKEFEKFRIFQDRTYQSDFDRLVAETSDDLDDLTE